MRLRHAFACSAISIVVLLLLVRHHILDLYQVARTYATYHKFIHSHHQEVIYRYPPADGEAQERESGGGTSKEQVPKIIHQIFLREGHHSTLGKYSDALASCQGLHPSWEHKLWTDDNATAFMREHYPVISPRYEGYQQSIQRANILRYALLDHFGGVYLDLDVTCLVPMDNLLRLPWLTPGAYPAGVNNAFILARPHHRFLGKVLSDVPGADLHWPLPYVENMLSTGCMFFSNRWMGYMRKLAVGAGEIFAEDRLYIIADQNGDLEPHMLRGVVTTPLFAHGGASSWHGWDAAAIVLIGKHYGYFLVLLAMVIAAASFALWKLLAPRSVISRRSWSPMARRSMEKRNDDEERRLADKDG